MYARRTGVITYTLHPVPQGVMLLIRVITGENWMTAMRDCAIEPPHCTSDAEAQRITGIPDMV
jgi:hypothetical protein